MSRFSSVRFGLYGRIASIHPMWAIDEYAMIFRVCVWFSPPHAPVKIDVIARIDVMVGLRYWEV